VIGGAHTRFTPKRHGIAAGAALAALLACPLAAGQSVSLQGTMGQRALVIIDGNPPRMLAPGQAHQGVRVVSVAADQAVVEVGGQRRTLQVGEAPVSVGRGAGAPTGQRIVLTAGSHGHFTGLAAVNGRTIPFLLDTGASVVALGASDAGEHGQRPGPALAPDTFLRARRRRRGL
jgi:aspartyl protease family protein